MFRFTLLLVVTVLLSSLSPVLGLGDGWKDEHLWEGTSTRVQAFLSSPMYADGHKSVLQQLTDFTIRGNIYLEQDVDTYALRSEMKTPAACLAQYDRLMQNVFAKKETTAMPRSNRLENLAGLMKGLWITMESKIATTNMDMASRITSSKSSIELDEAEEASARALMHTVKASFDYAAGIVTGKDSTFSAYYTSNKENSWMDAYPILVYKFDLLTADEILELDTRQALSVENQRELMKIAASV